MHINIHPQIDVRLSIDNITLADRVCLLIARDLLYEHRLT